MIVADRREGVYFVPEARIVPFWRRLDRNLPLSVKMAIPIVAITVICTTMFGLFLAQQAGSTVDSSYLASGQAMADAAAADTYSHVSNTAEMNTYLASLVQLQPAVLGARVHRLDVPGFPAVASSVTSEIGQAGLLDSADAFAAERGQTTQYRHTVQGVPVLETVVPVRDAGHVVFAVVVRTSLQAETAAVTGTLTLTGLIALLVAVLEMGALYAVMELGVLRRIRRMSVVVHTISTGRGPRRLDEGAEPEGRDALFNLARRMDQALVELDERERAGSVVNELGRLALAGSRPDELTRKSLDLTRQAAGLDRCLLVERVGAGTVVESFGGPNERTADATLPVWMGALVRAAITARRPILAHGLGQDSWLMQEDTPIAGARAALVPLPGAPFPNRVMVGIAPVGQGLSSAALTLMGAVATALGESLQRAEAEAARRESEVKSRALSTVSHEMRNPLSAMLGFTDLLLSGSAGELNQKQQQYVRHVHKGSEHLLNLVNDYLDLARLMAGSIPLNVEDIPVATVVTEVLQMLEPTASQKNVMLRSSGTHDAVAHVDRLRLRQVLTNLVSNAIAYTPPRGWVSVEVGHAMAGVRISVVDSGVGIPADRQHLVFTEFAQIRNASVAKSGTGLGLALTKRFVEAMGGTIRFTSAEDAGTCFDVWLPTASSNAAEQAEDPAGKVA